MKIDMKKIMKYKLYITLKGVNPIKRIFSDDLLIANFLGNLFFSISYPTIHFVLIKDVGEKIISLNAIVMCLVGIVFPILWNKKSDFMYRKYGYLLTIEGISYILLTILFICGLIDSKFYYLLDTLLFAIIAKNIICGGNRLRASRYKNEDREEYDNNSALVSNSSSLIGFTISFLFVIPTNIAFILIAFGIIIDNIFYYKAYKTS